MKKRYTVLGLSLFLAMALAVPALGGPSNPVASISASVKKTANKALKKAKTAQTTANNALSAANSAQSLASTVQGEAKKAKSTADSAKAAADEAKSAAATAQSTADSAKAAAEAANANANTRLKTSSLALGTATANDNTAEKHAEVTCPAGTVVLGGGAFINTTEPKKVHVVTSNPQAIYSQGWFVEGATNEGQTATWSITAEAMCGGK
jgi:hypothetical protein